MKEITFHWNTINKFPEKTGEPIICVTRTNKLCLIYYNPKTDLWKERWSWMRYKKFENVIRHYGIIYWAYQKEIL